MTPTREQVQACLSEAREIEDLDMIQIAEALLQAWDEVETLRNALEHIRDKCDNGWCAEAFLAARQALEVRE